MNAFPGPIFSVYFTIGEITGFVLGEHPSTVSYQFGAFHFGERQFDACQFGALHFDAVPVWRVSVWRDASLARFPFWCLC